MNSRYRILLAALLVVLTTGCRSWLETGRITEPVSELRSILKEQGGQDPVRREHRIAWLALIDSWIDRAEQIAASPPGLKGRISSDPKKTEAFLEANGAALSAWIAELHEPLEGLRRVTWAATRSAVEGMSNPGEAARDYSVAFFSLRAIEHLAGKSELALMPLVSALGMFEKAPEGSAAIVSKFALVVGIKIVAAQDMGRVSERIRLIGPGPEISRTFKALALQARDEARERAAQARQWRELDQASAESSKKSLRRLQESPEVGKLLGQTLIYVPGVGFSITKFLAVVSNLSWGLINTAVGVGIILVAAVASPFSSYVDFPSFQVADNEFQIWVGLRGMVHWDSAFSMGTWIFGGSSMQMSVAHEGGHSFQSAVLGPFYLPMVGVSYLLQGHKDSFMERWADAWAA
jgi:hypothetical protein